MGKIFLVSILLCIGLSHPAAACGVDTHPKQTKVSPKKNSKSGFNLADTAKPVDDRWEKVKKRLQKPQKSR